MLSGTFTAIVTPFNSDGSIDFKRLENLIEKQVEGGVDGVVPVGTTGESPTLSQSEQFDLVRATVDICQGRIAVIAGSGANSTAKAIELTKRAKEAGADATLQVTPYYNKPNQNGLLTHFFAIAELGLPVVLYNVPGRTGREISIDTVVELSQHPNIVALKEAGGSVDRVSVILTRCDITVLSGDDILTFPIMAVGGKGVVSVASNIIPKAVSAMTHYALESKWEDALSIHRKFHNLFKTLFIDTNPIPVKTALAMMGLIEENFRLPLCSMRDEYKRELRNCLNEFEVI